MLTDGSHVSVDFSDGLGVLVRLPGERSVLLEHLVVIAELARRPDLLSPRLFAIRRTKHCNAAEAR